MRGAAGMAYTVNANQLIVNGVVPHTDPQIRLQPRGRADLVAKVAAVLQQDAAAPDHQRPVRSGRRLGARP